MFFFGRGTQGAEQRIYPYPLYDNLTNIKADQNYDLVYLENEYVKIGIAPELGGKLFSAVDKTNNYDFIYRQHVIKPALTGLTGAWISGGVEWNIAVHIDENYQVLFPPHTQLMAEDWLVNPRQANAESLFSTLRNHPVNAQEIAAGYLECGLWEDGEQVLTGLVESTAEKTRISPIVYYCLAYFADQTDEPAKADEYRKQAKIRFCLSTYSQ